LRKDNWSWWRKSFGGGGKAWVGRGVAMFCPKMMGWKWIRNEKDLLYLFRLLQ